MFVGLLLSILAYPLLIIKGPLALFVFFLVILGKSRSTTPLFRRQLIDQFWLS